MAGLLRARPSGSSPWGTVCRSGFGTDELRAACSSVGYARVGTVTADWRFVQGDGTSYFSSVACDGGADSLSECNFTTAGCTHTNDLAVNCAPSTFPNVAAPAPSGWEYQLLAVTGGHVLQLRPSPFAPWGYACIDAASQRNYFVARAMCLSAGYKGAKSVKYSPLYSYPANSVFYTKDVRECATKAASIHDCTFDYRTEYQPAGLSCAVSAPALRCRGTPPTATATMTPTHRPTATRTFTPTAAATPSVSLILSPTVTATWSAAATASASLERSSSHTIVSTPSSTQSVSSTATLTRSGSPASRTSTPSTTSSPSPSTSTSRTVGTATPSTSSSESATATAPITASSSPSISITCPVYPDPTNASDPQVEGFDRCEFLRLARTSADVRNESGPAAWMLDDGTNRTAACDDDLAVPYAVWGGQVGDTFVVALFGRDLRLPLHAAITGNGTVGPRAADFASAVAPTIDNGRLEAVGLREGPRGVFFLTLAYRGKKRLTGGVVLLTLVANVDANTNPPLEPVYVCAAPLSAPRTFRLILANAARLLPASLGSVSEGTDGTAALLGSIMVNPTTIVLLGTISTLREMSRCEPLNLTIPLGIANSPMGLAFGPEEGAPQRGAVAGAAIIFAAFVVLLALVQLVLRRRSGGPWLPTTTGSGPHGAPSAKDARLLFRGSSALVPVAVFAVDVAMNSGAALFTRSPYSADVGIAVCCVVASLGYLGIVTRALRTCPLVEHPAPVPAHAPRSPFWALLRWATSPVVVWAPPWAGTRADEAPSATATSSAGTATERLAADAWRAEHAAYVEDVKGSRWFLLAEICATTTISTMEAAATQSIQLCTVRSALALAITLALAASFSWLRPVAVRFKLAVLMTLFWAQAIVATLSLASLLTQSKSVELATDSIGLAATLLVLLMVVLEAASLGLQPAKPLRQSLATIPSDHDIPLLPIVPRMNSNTSSTDDDAPATPPALNTPRRRSCDDGAESHGPDTIRLPSGTISSSVTTTCSSSSDSGSEEDFKVIHALDEHMAREALRSRRVVKDLDRFVRRRSRAASMASNAQHSM